MDPSELDEAASNFTGQQQQVPEVAFESAWHLTSPYGLPSLSEPVPGQGNPAYPYFGQPAVPLDQTPDPHQHHAAHHHDDQSYHPSFEQGYHPSFEQGFPTFDLPSYEADPSHGPAGGDPTSHAFQSQGYPPPSASYGYTPSLMSSNVPGSIESAFVSTSLSESTVSPSALWSGPLEPSRSTEAADGNLMLSKAQVGPPLLPSALWRLALRWRIPLCTVVGLAEIVCLLAECRRAK